MLSIDMMIASHKTGVKTLPRLNDVDTLIGDCTNNLYLEINKK
jgi:hypothetical protein